MFQVSDTVSATLGHVAAASCFETLKYADFVFNLLVMILIEPFPVRLHSSWCWSRLLFIRLLGHLIDLKAFYGNLLFVLSARR